MLCMQNSVQECNDNAVCITFICHYHHHHHHYHDVLSVWQSACNMNGNSSYWSCFSMKHLIIAGRERQLGFKKAPDVGKTAFKLLFVASGSLQHTEKLQQFDSLISSDVSVMFLHQCLCCGHPRKTVNFILRSSLWSSGIN